LKPLDLTSCHFNMNETRVVQVVTVNSYALIATNLGGYQILVTVNAPP
jgi:hypothetical protein